MATSASARRGTPDLPLRILPRIVLLPGLAGIAYEVIRYTAAHEDNALVRALAVPGLALQKLTTRPPDDDQIEVAISAMTTAIDADVRAAPSPPPAWARAPPARRPTPGSGFSRR